MTTAPRIVELARAGMRPADIAREVRCRPEWVWRVLAVARAAGMVITETAAPGRRNVSRTAVVVSSLLHGRSTPEAAWLAGCDIWLATSAQSILRDLGRLQRPRSAAEEARAALGPDGRLPPGMAAEIARRHGRAVGTVYSAVSQHRRRLRSRNG